MNADYTAYAGDTIELIVSIVDENNTPLDVTGASAIYAISRTAQDASVLVKATGDGIVISGDMVLVTLQPADSALLVRAVDPYDLWHHELELVGPDGATSTVLHGNVRIKRTVIA